MKDQREIISTASATEDWEEDGAIDESAALELRSWRVDERSHAMRLDRALAEQVPEFSRSYLQQLIEAGAVQLDGQVVRKPAHRVRAGQQGVVELRPTPQSQAFIPESMALDIVYQDAHLLVINKPAGLVVHPAAGNWRGTLLNGLLAFDPQAMQLPRAGIVHRLDKDTTGLMVVAKNDAAHQSLTAQFADHGRTNEMRRGYMAFAWGVPNRPRGTVDAPIDRHPHAREKMAVREGGREAVTHWNVLEEFPDRMGRPVATLLECQLETGRTHQIRVHLAHIQHPLMGDAVYGPHFKTKASSLGPLSKAALEALDRQALHAYLLALEHPRTGEILEWTADLPDDLAVLRNHLRVPE